MIVELNISNFAIIDDLKINFTNGFNVMTGETGAGKSIIVEGMGMILGERASKNLIKTGKDKATVEGLFYLDAPEKINGLLMDYGIDIDPNKYLIISREIHANGPSISRLNGRVVTLSMLNKITANLVDIHGQSEHLSLLKTSNHMKIIDNFGDRNLLQLRNKIRDNYHRLSEERKKLQELSVDAIERDREIDLLKYQLDEINEANLAKIDEDAIIKEYKKIDNIQAINDNLSQVASLLNISDYDSISILDNINKAITKLGSIEDYDKKVLNYKKILLDVNFQLQDLFREITDYIDILELDEGRLAILEDTIDIINNLKRKYGNTIEDILQYRNEIEERMELLTNIETEVEACKRRIEEIEKILEELSIELTGLRKKLGHKLEGLITRELKELNMDKVVFKVQYEKLDYFTANGWDKIEFLISTNKGQDLKPLSKIVSGGEMSRIMLAFKSILADMDKIPCLIFDEIDAGISGRTAQTVGEKIKKISKNHQIISISHLPQIAALADNHFLIEKSFDEDETYTRVKKLDKDERIDELARLLGGVDLTDTTRLHAKEMLAMSQNLK